MQLTHGMIPWQLDMIHSPEQVHAETSFAFDEKSLHVYRAPSDA